MRHAARSAAERWCGPCRGGRSASRTCSTTTGWERADPDPRRRVTLGPRGVTVDFTGSSPQTAGPGERRRRRHPRGRDLRGEDRVGRRLPGQRRRVRGHPRIAPPGTVVNAAAGPRRVAAGNVETSQRIVDVVLGALAHALPPHGAGGEQRHDEQPADRRPRSAHGGPFAYYETLGGGHGAGPGGDGASAMQVHMTNTRNTPVESLEHAYPLRVRGTRGAARQRGLGRHRGGDGIERALEPN